MATIAASVLGADLMNLGEELRRVEQLGVTWLHLDQMDGHFVPNISFGPGFVSAMRGATDLFFDVHLMLSHPLAYVDAYADAGADLIVVHAEAEDDPETTLRAIRARGIQAGICIRPDTPPEAVETLLPLCDLVLVMTVEPGLGGQSLMERCLDKLPILREMIARTGRDILLEVDGGLKQENAARAVAAGADVLVIGTGLFCATNPAEVVRTISALEYARERRL